MTLIELREKLREVIKTEMGENCEVTFGKIGAKLSSTNYESIEDEDVKYHFRVFIKKDGSHFCSFTRSNCSSVEYMIRLLELEIRNRLAKHELTEIEV